MIMRTMIAVGLAATALATAASPTDAADRQPRRERHAVGRHGVDPDNPPPAGAQRLLAFRGVWQFDGTVAVQSQRPRKARWRLGCGSVAGGWALACDDTVRIPRQPVMRSHDLTTFDPKTGVIHLFTASNSGDSRELRGRWVNDRTIRYHYEGMLNGKRVVEDATLALRDATTFDLDDVTTVGGQPSVAFHGTFHQQERHARRDRNARNDNRAASADEGSGDTND